MDPKVTETAIDDLIIDPEVNIRARTPNSRKIQEYADIAATQERAPIDTFTVIEEEAGLLGEYIINGVHRTAGRREAGLLTVFCINRGKGTLAQAKDASDLSNIGNGLENTPEQMKEIGIRLHQRHPDWGQVEIALKCKVTQATVSRWLTGKSGHESENYTQRIKGSKSPAGLLTKVVRDCTRWWKTSTSREPVDGWEIRRLEASYNETGKVVEIHQQIGEALEKRRCEESATL